MDKKFPAELRDKISRTRENKGISQELMAEKINQILPENGLRISQKSYSNIENGTIKSPKTEYLTAIATILEMEEDLKKYISKKEIIALGKKVPMRLKEEEFAEAFPEWEGVPVYNVEVSASFVTKYTEEESRWEPLYYLRDPQFRDCDFAARIAGDSMHAEIRHGDYIICQEVIDKSIIIYGEIYYVVTINGLQTCKYVNAMPIYNADPNDMRKMYDFERVLLVPKNDSISPTPLNKSDISKLYKVKGIVRGY